MIYLWVFIFLLPVRLDSSNFVYMLHWKDWNWISNECKVSSSSKKTLTNIYVNLKLHSVQFIHRLAEVGMQGLTKGRSLRSRRQKGKGKQKFWGARMLKTETFSPLFPFPPSSCSPRAVTPPIPLVPVPVLKLPHKLLLGD